MFQKECSCRITFKEHSRTQLRSSFDYAKPLFIGSIPGEANHVMLPWRKASGFEMKTFIRILTCSIVGAASGAFCGAVLFGIATYLEMNSPTYGNDRIGWAALSGYLGAIIGLVFWIVIGFIVVVHTSH